MLRAFFLAIGMYLILLSAQLTMVQDVKASWKKPEQVATGANAGPQWQFKVSKFMPYSTLCVGTVVCIYAIQIPKRINEMTS